MPWVTALRAETDFPAAQCRPRPLRPLAMFALRLASLTGRLGRARAWGAPGSSVLVSMFGTFIVVETPGCRWGVIGRPRRLGLSRTDPSIYIILNLAGCL